MKYLILFFIYAATLAAQPSMPWGTEFRVNSYTQDIQLLPAICGLSGGGFVVCWTSSGQDGSRYGIYAQRYSGNGQPIGSEFRVNSYTQSDQSYPAIGSLSDGGFVICWSSWYQDGSRYGIYAQRYSGSGQPAGSEFRVNSYTQSNQYLPAICGLSGGGFVVCWTSSGQDGSRYGIYAQRYSGNGQPIGSEFRVNSYTENNQQYSAIGSLSDGGFVVCWTSSGQDGSRYGIYAQRYSGNGQPIGSEFRVNSYTQSDQWLPAIGSLSDGGFVICWDSNGQDGSRNIYAQRYSGNGQPKGSEFRVNSYTQSDQWLPAIGSLSDGGFVICWDSNGQDGSRNIYAQRYSGNGQPKGSEFRVNSYTQDHQYDPAIGRLSDDGVVICWDSFRQDGSRYDIYAKPLPEHPLQHNLHAFAIKQPANDQTVNTTKPILTWQSASDKIVAYPWELEYTVYYDTLADFRTARLDSAGLDTSLQLLSLTPGKTYFWKVLAKTYYGDSLWSNTSAFFVSHTATKVQQNAQPPTGFLLSQNFPNPFNPWTTISFELPRDGFVTLNIYDLTGRLVRTLVQSQYLAGVHSIQWNGTDDTGQKITAGVYLYQIEFTDLFGNKRVLTKKMSLVK